jgi:hypothetical protein
LKDFLTRRPLSRSSGQQQLLTGPLSSLQNIETANYSFVSHIAIQGHSDLHRCSDLHLHPRPRRRY